VTKLLVVDTETTGTDPERHDIWEIAVIELPDDGPRVEHAWRILPDLAVADQAALQVSGFYERTAGMLPEKHGEVCDFAAGAAARRSDPAALAAVLASLLSGATWLGAVPAFDEKFIAPFLRLHGQGPAWKYRLRDLGSMAYGYLLGRNDGFRAAHPAALGMPAVPPMDASTDEFARALGVDPAAFGRHSALEDCRLFAACLAVIRGRAAPEAVSADG